MPVRGTIVVPTYKEKENLHELVVRVFAGLADSAWANAVEMIVVDDNSNDGSEDVIHACSRAGHPVRIIVRNTERGLSSAVLRGFDECASSSQVKVDFTLSPRVRSTLNTSPAAEQVLLCMDADLQHPPESLPLLLDAVSAVGGADFVIGTRYGEGTLVDKSWPLYRRVLSGGARLLAQPLSPLSDPMSGFFGLPRSVYLAGRPRVNPIGYKIALELCVKCHCSKIGEVPINFGVRTHGESKLSSKVIFNYVKHLAHLYAYRLTAPGVVVVLFLLLFLAHVLLSSVLY